MYFGCFYFFVNKVYFTSKVNFKLTLNSVTSLSLTTALWSCTNTDLMFFTLLEACHTAFFVASSQLLSEFDNTSITFNTAILLFFNVKF